MRSDTLSTVQQLAHTRQAIAQHLATPSRSNSASDSTAHGDATWAIPSAFADLVLVAVAEKLLRQFTPLRQPIRSFPALQNTQALLHATAQTYPVGLVIGAALIGAAVAATRPWRYLKFADVMPQLLAQLATHVLAQIKDGQPSVVGQPACGSDF